MSDSAAVRAGLSPRAVQTGYPSWGYMIESGATSMWEHWSREARSYGHYFLGTVDDWFYQHVAGIQASPETGYRDITIAPAVTGHLDRAAALAPQPVVLTAGEHALRLLAILDHDHGRAHEHFACGRVDLFDDHVADEMRGARGRRLHVDARML